MVALSLFCLSRETSRHGHQGFVDNSSPSSALSNPECRGWGWVSFYFLQFPFISSRCYSLSSKVNFISLPQTSIKCPPYSIHCRVLCSFELWFGYFASFCQSCSPCHSSVAAKHFYLLPNYSNLKPHFFLLSKYLFCSGSWGVLCWLRDQWDPITPPVWAVNQWKAAVASAVAGCLWLTASARRFSPAIVHRLLSSTGCECPSCFHWDDGLLKTQQSFLR